jgi:hypothetical protein
MIFNELWMFVSMLLQRLDHYTNNSINNISSNSRTNNIRSSLDLLKGSSFSTSSSSSSSSSTSYQKTPVEVVQAVFSSSWSSVLRYAPLLDELSTEAPMSLKAASPDYSQQLRIGCSSYAYGQHHGK